MPGYSASKGGIAQLTKSPGDRLRPEGRAGERNRPRVDCNATDAAERSGTRRSDSGANADGRWGTPEDLQGIALFLASPHAGFITGTIVPVDGGLRRHLRSGFSLTESLEQVWRGLRH